MKQILLNGWHDLRDGTECVIVHDLLSGDIEEVIVRDKNGDIKGLVTRSTE